MTRHDRLPQDTSPGASIFGLEGLQIHAEAHALAQQQPERSAQSSAPTQRQQARGPGHVRAADAVVAVQMRKRHGTQA